jgi:hypothetical protein
MNLQVKSIFFYFIKILANLVRFSIRLVFFLILLVLITGILFRIPQVQTYVAQRAAAYISDKIGIEIKIDKIRIAFFHTVELKGLTVYDHHHDTLLHAGNLLAKLDFIHFNTREIVVGDVDLQESRFRLHKYKGEDGLNIDWLIDKLSGDTPPDTTPSEPWHFRINNIHLTNVEFNHISDEETPLPAAFQPGNIRAMVKSADIRNFRVAADSIIMDIDKMKVLDRSGVNIKNLTTHFVICKTAMLYENCTLETNKSLIAGDIRFLYKSFKSYGEFVDSVKFKTLLKSSRVHSSDIAYYTDALKGLDMYLGVSGAVQGPISDFVTDGMTITTLGGTKVKFSGELLGLPDIYKTKFMLDFDELASNPEDLALIQIPPFHTKQYLDVPEQIKSLGKFGFKGSFNGSFFDFNVSGKLISEAGDVLTTFTLKEDIDKKRLNYEGHLTAESLQLGKILGIENILGSITGKFSFKGYDFNPKKIHVQFESNIKEISLNDYNYQNLSISGLFDKLMFNGIADLKDPNAQMLFSGAVDFSKTMPYFNFTTELFNWNLHPLHLFNRDSLTLNHGLVTLNCRGSSLDDIVGTIYIDSLDFTNKNEKHFLKDLKFTADTFLTSRSLKIQSSYLDASFTGGFKINELTENVKMQFVKYIPSLNLEFDKKLAQKESNVVFDLHVKNLDPIFNIFLPELHIAPKSKIDGSYISKIENLDIHIQSPGIKYDTYKFENWNLTLQSAETQFAINSTADKFYVTDSMYFKKFNIYSKTRNDSLNLNLAWAGDAENLTKGYFKASTYFGNTGKYNLKFDKSFISFQDTLWTLTDGAYIEYADNKLKVNNFDLKATSGENIMISGTGGTDVNHVIRLIVNDFPIRYVNRFLAPSVRLSGVLSGYIGVFSLFNKPFVEGDLLLAELKVNKTTFGNLYFKSNYDDEKGLVTVNAVLEDDNYPKLSVKDGLYYPFKKSNQFDIKADVADLDLVLAETFTAPDFVELGGTLSANLYLKGTVKKPELTGQAQFKDAKFKIAATGASYVLNSPPKEPIIFDPQKINITKLNIRDEANTVGVISGLVTHNYFEKIYLQLSLNAKNFILLNAPEKDNIGIYGQAITTGLVNIYGTSDNIHIYSKAQTNAGTKLYIPLSSGTSSALENNFVTFKSFKTGKLSDESSVKQIKTSALSLEIDADITPDAEVQLIFDQRTGDIIKTFGKGTLRIELTNKSDFFLYGDYEVYKGDYLFTFENIVSKRLQLQNGGTISWSGNPSAAKIDAGAIYNIRTSPAALMEYASSSNNSSETDNFKARIPVEVIVKLKGDLTEPGISFDIEFPSVDERTKTQLMAALSNQDEKNKQAFALLVLGQFTTPGNAAGSVGGSALGANSLEVISNQLSNLISQLNPNIAASLRYRNKGNTSSGSDEVEVGLSGRLLNDRIIIDGNVGMPTRSNNSNNTASVIDINIDFKVTKDGKFRLKAFNRSNDMNIIRPFPYTQGVGVSYQTSFTKWGDLFQKRRKETAIPDSTKVK